MGDGDYITVKDQVTPSYPQASSFMNTGLANLIDSYPSFWFCGFVTQDLPEDATPSIYYHLDILKVWRHADTDRVDSCVLNIPTLPKLHSVSFAFALKILMLTSGNVCLLISLKLQQHKQNHLQTFDTNFTQVSNKCCL